MKFLHLSDLHIGIRLYDRDLTEDQKEIFRQIAEYAKKEQPDAIVIAGDIYDKAVPSAESVELFDGFVQMLCEAAPASEIMMISGNHDSAPRINLFRGILGKHHVHMIGMPPTKPDEYVEQVTLKDEYGPVHFYLLPFVKPSMVRQIVITQDMNQQNENSVENMSLNSVNEADSENLEAAAQDERNSSKTLSYAESFRRLIVRENINTEERNVLVSHQFFLPHGKKGEEVERMDSETFRPVAMAGNLDEIPQDCIDLFDYAALGHIHKPMKVGSEVLRYCGTPLAYSMSEAGQKKSMLCVELQEKGVCTVRELPLHPLREVREIKGTLEEVLKQKCGDFVRVVLTDKADLDVLDMQDCLRAAFPYLLNISRENIWQASYETPVPESSDFSPLDLCRSFLGDADEEMLEILREVLNEIGEGGAR